jgi:hypothetical protein
VTRRATASTTSRTLDYLYTDAWVRKLARDLSDVVAFEILTGHEPETVAAAAAA